ncbi:prephenate dehydrogenase/arogenate dehydrogenase family protein [Candidatus Dojkabacteria bacterium]|nr:prephenate dehydrogenase/arogenate dehydrogenase family protein [Candidatus Dojkabacteria bacterium]
MEITIGIIGYGEFGKFISDLFLAKFPKEIKCKIYSRSHRIDNKRFYSMDEICSCDFIIPCSPISKFEDTIHSIVDLIKPNTILFEVCSVKVFPNQILKKYTSQLNFVTTHPMFGPRSFKTNEYNLEGKKFVITDSNLDSSTYSNLITLLKSYKLDVIECTSYEHDELAAKTQFRTHLIAQLFKELKATKTLIDTFSYTKLLESLEIARSNNKLFEEIFMYNPYAKTELTKVIKALSKISTKLNKI